MSLLCPPMMQLTKRGGFFAKQALEFNPAYVAWQCKRAEMAEAERDTLLAKLQELKP